MALDINIVGTGGIIEGNLGAANVNVNLDAAYDFVGSDDEYITIADNSALDLGADDFTLSCWTNAIYTSQGSSYNSLIAKGDAATSGASYALNLLASGEVRFKAGDGEYISTATGKYANDGTWAHIAATKSGSTLKIYINGADAGGARTGSADDDTDNNDALILGGDTSSSRHITGKLGDARIYDAALSASNIQVLASKINVNTALGAGTTNLVGYWPIIGTSIDITDNSTNSNNGTAVNSPTTVYDAFSVNVQDNSTTTDGTFTVTQGKLEGLSLTSLTFDGDNDYIPIDVEGTIERTADTTISMWIKPDEFQNNRLIGDDAGSANDYLAFKDNSSSLFKVSINGNNANFSGVSPAWETGKWQLVTVTHDYSSGDITLYRNGVNQSTVNIGANAAWTIARIGHVATGDYYDGGMRDVKIFDYLLSDDQVASLYSGSYNVTPAHWWKFEQGTGGNSDDFTDDGTASRRNGDIFGATWVNGTLDLDSTLTIAANGTMSCPRGTLDLASNLDINCTTVANQWIHNNGKVDLSSTSSDNELSPNGATFYNMDKSGSVRARLFENMTVEGTLDLTGSTSYFDVDCDGSAGNITLTMGTATSSGTISVDTTNTMRIRTHSSRIPTIQGVSTLYPCNVTGVDWDWNATVGAAGVQLANMNFDPDVVTGTGGVKITLTGDCEFDAVTLSGGDTLNLNGQRMECSGLLDLEGHIDTPAGSQLWLGGGIDYDGQSWDDGELADIILTGSGVTNDFAGQAYKTIMFNGSGTHKLNWTADFGATDFIVASNFTPDHNFTCTDLTVATGATLDAEGDTLTVAGDFTTSGGLIGKSAATFDGTGDYISAADHSSLNITGALTVEAWVKTSSSSSMRIINKDDGSNRDYFLMSLDGSRGYRFGIFNSNTEYQVTSGADTAYADGKWHHVAGVFTPSTSLEIYVDGKLEAINTSSIPSAIDNDTEPLWIGAMGDGSAYWNGNIARVSVWSEALTQAKIRAMLFQDWTTMAADATHTDSNAELWWEFNEGTGTVSDSSSNSNTGTFTNATWAGAGTFTYGTSTLVMSGSSKKLTWTGNENVGSLQISGTTTLQDLAGNDGYLQWNGALIIDSSKTLSSTSAERLICNGSSDTIEGAGLPTGLVGLYTLETFHTSGTIRIGACTTPRLKCWDGGTVEATGDLTLTTELEVNSGTTFNANGNTITAHEVDCNGSATLNLANSTLSFSRSSGYTWNNDSTVNLLSGNTTVIGRSSSEHANCYLPSAGDFEIVGDVKWLEIESGGDLTVIGSVTDCSFANSTANIRQWHHTLDTQQLLDADEAGDDDLRLTKPALDNAHELMTG